ncbi:hypothetical protein Hanom_Chr02g00105421 [Helianthus anomalus]
MADVEEGEIRQNSTCEDEFRDNNQQPVEIGDSGVPTGGFMSSPVECRKSSEFQSDPEGQKSHGLPGNVEMCNMHGEGGHVPHECINVDGSGEEFNESTDFNIPVDGGPNILNPVENLSGPNNLFGEEGPTPVGNLRKRNREERSPSSFGSMQGPAQRPLFHAQNSHTAWRRYSLGLQVSMELAKLLGFKVGGVLPLMRLQRRSVLRLFIPSYPI